MAPVPDDDRKRRRLGDETKGRIADLASGWDTPGAAGAAPDPGPTGPAGNAPRRVKQKTLPPPPPGSVARRELEETILDLTEDLEAESSVPRRVKVPTPPAVAPHRDSIDIDIDVVDDDEDEDDEDLGGGSSDDGGWELVTSAGSGGPRARRPSSVRNGPSESGTVDVSGLIPEKTQPPELLVPVPTVDASALGVATGPASRPPAVDRSGAVGTPRSGPVLGPRPGPPAPPGPPVPPRSGTRTSPPPPPGARVTGAAPLAPGTSTPPSGAVAAVPASGRTSMSVSESRGGDPAGSARGAGRSPVGSMSGRLPLPPDAPAAAPPRPSTTTPPRPTSTPPPGRAARAAFLIDESGLETVPEAARRSNPHLAVPVGEFDSSSTVLEHDKRRLSHEQATIARDPANAVLGIAEPPLTVVKEPPIEVLLDETAAQIGRGDPTTIDPATHRFERGDPTIGADPTGVRLPGDVGPVTPKGRLRTIAQLRRRRGVGGDLRYVWTAIFGLRRARREIAQLEAKEALLQQSRRRHLITLGRTAVTADGFDHPALGRTRELLAGIEEERSRHAGQVTAADAELLRVNRDREAKAQQHAVDLAALDDELAEVAKKLEPLEKEIASVTRRAADLRDAMRRIDEKIAFTEASLSSADAEKTDRDAIQAEIASLKADRKSVQKDEPVLASALDSLHPRIAKLEGARAEARKRRAELEQAELEDQRRVEELLTAIGAKRKVVDRAANDAEAARDKILFELGERLYVDRPDSMAPELSPIDAIDVELGTVDRRTMELREILQSVDRMKIARGIALWILLFTAIGVITALVLGVTPPF